MTPDDEPEEIYELARRRVVECRDSESDTLNLSHHRLMRLPPEIVTCAKLRKLDIRHTGINDLALLAELTELQELICLGSKLTTLESLRELHKLRVLDCRFTDINDVAPLQALDNLTVLRASETLTATLAPLESLTNLVEVDISGRASLPPTRGEVSDLSPLRHNRGLLRIDCSRTKVRSLECLREIAGIERLACARTQVSDLAPLADTAALSILDCSGTQVSSLAPIARARKLTILRCSETLVSDLEPLRSLGELRVFECENTPVSNLDPLRGHSNLSILNCRSSQVSSLETFSGQSALTDVDCYETHVSSLEPLRAHVGITRVSCSKTPISSLEPLRELSLLEELYCGDTQILSIEALHELRSLKKFSCPTKVKSLEPLRAHLQLAMLHCGSEVADVPLELLQGECSQLVRGYFQDLEQGSAPDMSARVLLIGNGFVGKSTLAHCLVHGAPPADPLRERTHAIVSQPVALGEVDVRLWDFAGQDIYHATHRLFLRSGGLFVLVIAAVGDCTDPTPAVERHEPAYWLDLIRQLGGSTVIAVQNKADLVSKPVRIPDFTSLLKVVQPSPISATLNRGIAAFRATLHEEVRNLVDARIAQIGKSWVDCRAAMATITERKHISYEEYLSIAQEHKVLAPSALLTYLANAGHVYHAENAFGNRIFLDEEWIIQAAYRLFDTQPGGPRLQIERLQEGGRPILGQDLRSSVWRGEQDEEVEVYLGFMLSSEVLFEVNQRNNVPLSSRQFVVPALLPTDPAFSAEALREKNWDIHLEFEFAFLHSALIERLIVRTAAHNPGRTWWRSGAHWLDGEAQCDVLADADLGRRTICVRVSARRSGALPGNVPKAVARIRRLMQEAEQQLEAQLWLSPDGEHFASEQALSNAADAGLGAIACRGAVPRAIDEFRSVYAALGAQLPEQSRYVSPNATTVINYMDNRTYTANTNNSPGAATVQGDDSTATATGVIQSQTFTQDQHRENITAAQAALAQEQDALVELSSTMYEVLGQFLVIARKMQIGQENLITTQAKMKDTLDEIWASRAAKELRPAALPASLKVITELAKSPVMQEVVKALLNG